MCGLAGAMGPDITSRDLEFLDELGYVTALRGKDSTGVFQGKSNQYTKEVTLVKQADEYSYFKWFQENAKEGNPKILNNIQCNFIAIHCRAATKGDINDANAHPFETERYVGMHNGTLTDRFYHHKTKTDSELMFEDMDKNGIERVLRFLDNTSAFAIVMFDKQTGEMIFTRNSLRTLYFAYHKDRAVVYWSSEKEMINLIAARKNFNIIEPGYLPVDKVFRVLPDLVKKNAWPQWKETPLFQQRAIVSPPKTTDPKTTKGKATDSSKGNKDEKKSGTVGKTSSSGGKKGSAEETSTYIANAYANTEAGQQLIQEAKQLRDKSPTDDERRASASRALDQRIEEIRRKREADTKAQAVQEATVSMMGIGATPPWESNGEEDVDDGTPRTARTFPIIECAFCDNQLSLLDRYYGHHLGGNNYSCPECTREINEVSEHQKLASVAIN